MMDWTRWQLTQKMFKRVVLDSFWEPVFLVV